MLICKAKLLLCAFIASYSLVSANPQRVACVGDSITYGFGISDRANDSYPAQLNALLGEDWVVGNFGRNGATALKAGTVSYWDQTQYTSALNFSPDIVVIKLGTNDSRVRDWFDHFEEYVPDYVDLIESFQNLPSNPKVYICYSAPSYIGEGPSTSEFSDQRIRDEILPRVYQVSQQTGVEIINVHSALSGQRELFSDAVHPNEAGAKVIAETVAKAIWPLAVKASGSGSGYDISGSEAASFRSTATPKSFDIDGDNAYGTLGYYFFGNGSDATTNTDGVPSWVVSLNSASNVVVNSTYTDFDNPTQTIASSVSDWTSTGIGLVNNGVAGEWSELLSFTVDESAPNAFRIGVMAGNEETPSDLWDPVGIRILYSNSIVEEVVDLETDLGMVFFDVVLPEDFTGTFRIEGQTRDTTSDSGPSIAGIVFDPNSPPYATSMNVTTPEKTPLNIVLAGGDADSQNLTYTVLSPPDFGTLTGTAPNLTFAPDENYVGQNYFTYVTNDGTIDSNVATVSITTENVNKAPYFPVQPTIGDSAIAGTSYSSEVVAFDSDGDLLLVYSKVSGPNWLTVATDGTLSGSPDVTDIGTNQFSVSVSDPSLEISSTTLVIEVYEDGVVSIAPIGDGSGYDVEGEAAVGFRSTSIAKQYDLDEDHAYGSAGYFFYGNGVDASSNSDGKPSWVSEVNNQATTVSNSLYSSFNNPTEPISATVANWTTTTIGIINNGTAGAWSELLTFTVDSTAPRHFRVGIISGLEANSDGRWDPAALRVSGSQTIIAEVSNLDVNLGIVFFDITIPVGFTGTFSVEGQTRDVSSDKGPSIAGIMFDVPALPFSEWLDGHSLDATYSDDLDNDNIELLLEYVLNGYPLSPDYEILPTINYDANGYTFTFNRRAESVLDTQQVFQYSDDLENWTDLPITGSTSEEIAIGSELNDQEEITVTLPVPSSSSVKYFGRLKVTYTP